MKSTTTTTTSSKTSIISSEVIVIDDDKNKSEKSVGKLKKHDSADSTMPVAFVKISTTRKATKKSSKEQNQNETNNEFEKNSSAIRSSTPILQQQQQQQPSIQTRSKQYHIDQTATILSQSNGNNDLSDHAAYKEYKEAGEYWK